MSVYVDDDRTVYEESSDDKNDILGNISSRINKGGEPPTATMEAEKRMRREIANSNERRRMQSINNGFQSLRSLLPHHEGEKLSKAAILQQTAEYIYSLEQEKTRLMSQNCQLKRLMNQHDGGAITGGGGVSVGSGGELPPKKRKTDLMVSTSLSTSTAAAAAAAAAATESSDEGLGSMSPEPVGLITVTVNSAETPAELRRQLERERGLRLVLEEQVRQLENQLIQLHAGHVQQIYHSVEETEEISLQLVAADSVPPVGHTQTVVCSPPPRSRSPSPPVSPDDREPPRLPSVLEAAIKAEPKVEVERLPSPHHAAAVKSEEGRIYVSNTSRQNLETIVEAIRHLEGDHMFGDEPHSQDVPLALTTTRTTSEHVIKAEMNTYIDFHAAAVQKHQQSRPGVIVVKQAS